jgi:hypothetical protein
MSEAAFAAPGRTRIFAGSRTALCLLVAGFLLAACSASGPKLISSTSVNGQTVKVFAVGGASPSVDISQIGDTTELKIGAHTIVIKSDGSVTVDGQSKSYGKFTELDVTIGDGDKVDIKVAN